MKMRFTIGALAGLLIGHLAVQGQETDPPSPPPSLYPAVADKKDKSSGTEGGGKSAFHKLLDDENARSYYEPYYPRSYNTPTGYINPNYKIPARKDIDKNEKVDEAMQKSGGPRSGANDR